MSTISIISKDSSSYTQEVSTENFKLLSDAPSDLTSNPMGPSPHDLVYAALGACTSMTMQMYAKRKNLDLQKVEVKVKQLEKTNESETIEREISFWGNINQEDADKLKVIADKCPIHKLLVKAATIKTNFNHIK